VVPGTKLPSDFGDIDSPEVLPDALNAYLTAACNHPYLSSHAKAGKSQFTGGHKKLLDYARPRNLEQDEDFKELGNGGVSTSAEN